MDSDSYPDTGITRRRTRAVLTVTLVLQTALISWNNVWNSPVIDEVGHLTAGIRIWQTGQFDLYRVNPPLVKMVAALPAVAGRPRFDWTPYADSPRERHEWIVGQAFIRANGEDAFWYFMAGRFCCLPFAWIGTLVCFVWARERYGDEAGLLAAVLWCLSPNVLTWAATFTPDLAASSLGVLAAWRFSRWLDSPDWRNAGFAGVTLGLAELTKFTWVILFILWPLIWIVQRVVSRRTPQTVSWWSEGRQLAVIAGLGLYVLNLGYGFEGTGNRLGDFTFVSATLTGEDRGVWGNRFAGTVAAELPVPLPRNYVRGIDQQKVDFEKGMESYLLGEWRRPGGWWYYYCVCAAVKVPLGIWLLAVLRIVKTLRTGGLPMNRRPGGAILLLPPVAVFVLVSSQTGFGRYFRYVLPCFPFVFVWLGGALDDTWVRVRRFRLVVWAAAGGAALSMANVYPHTLSYFNAITGGPRGGSAVLLDANVDWGQDLLRMRDWLRRHAVPGDLFVMHTGFVSPAMLGIACEWPPAAVPVDVTEELTPEQRTSLGPRPGTYMISIHEYQRRRHRYRYLEQATLIDRIGYSMLVYRLTEAQAAEVRKTMKLLPWRPAKAGSPGGPARQGRQ